MRRCWRWLPPWNPKPLEHLRVRSRKLDRTHFIQPRLPPKIGHTSLARLRPDRSENSRRTTEKAIPMPSRARHHPGDHDLEYVDLPLVVSGGDGASMEVWTKIWGSIGSAFSGPLHFWQVIGWMGNSFFVARVLVQWHASERRGEVVVPVVFWWLSLFGSWCLLAYAIFWKRDLVFIFANAFNWIPFLRNLMIDRKHARSRVRCENCHQGHPKSARFCMTCGLSLESPIFPASTTEPQPRSSSPT